MKTNLLLYILGLLTFALGIKAQVSHGGMPLPLSLSRSLDTQFYKEMPSFDVAEELRLDSLDESDLRSGFRFAYKFITNYTPGNSGTSFTLADGTRVWRLGIYSPGAHSLNVLFTEYELPTGAQLFLYNADQTQVLGSFNDQNNSELNLLPISPIQGDRLIIEYQEPAGVPFRGRLTLGEVNHAYRDISKMEPGGNTTDITHIPPLACYQENPDYEVWGRSVVLLIIDGTIGCSAALVNNTENDGKPYLLTASHCLNNQFRVTNPDYEKVAGRVVCFFNYESPFCNPIVKGTEELSTASAKFRAVDEKGDMALLELLEIPPVYYRPYYAGWNVEEAGPAPYTCIQHPRFSVKRISSTDRNLSTSRMPDPYITFYKDAQWFVSKWDIGYTAGGSSGAPLFNAKGEIIGALSGGESVYSRPNNDYFFRLIKTWDNGNVPEKQLRDWLNPVNNDKKSCPGLDPYALSPAYRLSNVRSSGSQQLAECALYRDSGEGLLFGNNSGNTNEYAEAYKIQGAATLFGTYIVTPSAGRSYKDLEVEITVYKGDQKPVTIIHKEAFRPSYLSNQSNDDFVDKTKPLNQVQESYIRFSVPIQVSGAFYIGYRVKSAPANTYFAAYNLPKGKSARNTAWVLEQGTWKQATAYNPAGFSTSLFIDPVIRYGTHVGNEEREIRNPIQILQGTERGIVYVSLPDEMEKATYTLISIQGKTVQGGTISNCRAVLNFQSLPQGTYLVKVDCGNTSHTQKIIF